MTFRHLIQELEQWAPPALQESYDNSGLMVGEAATLCTGALLTLDITEAIIQEAEDRGCNLILAHHPIWFQPRKRLNGEDLVSRCILMAARKNIGLYSIHTNLDNVQHGVNKVIADRLGLKQVKILDPKSGLIGKLVVYVPETHREVVLSALFEAGAGNIGKYQDCSFQVSGTGTFRPLAEANPYIGISGRLESVSETQIEVIFPIWAKNKILQAMYGAHPYEEVAYQVFKTENSISEYGAGMIGTLDTAIPKQEFLQLVRNAFQTGNIRYADKTGDSVQKIAICGGSGSFLISRAMQMGADALVTADVTYHKFFEGEGKMMILDIGHYESEQFTPWLIHEYLSEKFPNFALHLSKIRTNPVQYF
jgi:dinuclear metal center YbgI/SA1388 family protein